MSGVYWRHGTSDDKLLLETFACAKPNVRQGSNRRVPPEPWATQVQRHIRQEAIRELNTRSRTHDQRIVLVFDEDLLAAIFIHEDAQELDIAARILVCGAVALRLRGKNLSNGRSALEQGLICLLEDVRQIHPEGAVTGLGWVHPRNERCLGALRRLGWQVREGDSDELLEVSGRLL